MITIGISSHNHAEYLSDAIESALDQTVPREIIVVDDGSTDNSLEIARRYAVKVVSQTNRGMASARNTALLHTESEWFLPLDSDDILLPEAVETLEKAIKSNLSVSVVSPSFKCFGVSNDSIILDSDLKLEDFRENNRLPYCSAIRKADLIEVGGYNPNPKLWGVNDYYLWVELLKKGKEVLTLKDVLFLYRTREGSMWTEALTHEPEWRSIITADHPELYEA